VPDAATSPKGMGSFPMTHTLKLAEKAKKYYEEGRARNIYSGYERNVLVRVDHEQCIFVDSTYELQPGDVIFRCKTINQATVIEYKNNQNLTTMGTATVSTRLDEAIIKQLEDIYQKPGTGASVAAEAYVFIRRHTLRELNGMFNKEELIGMISNLNGTMLQAEFQANPSMYAIHLEDGEQYMWLSKQYGFDFEILMQKVRKLTAAQVFFLQEEIRLFWEDEGRDLDKFIERFI
jgi:hypothetical protein